MFASSIVAAVFALGVTASPVAKRQNVPVGVAISSCTVAGTVALTFDDGPFAYTSQILDELDAAGMKGTFFMNGQNWASITDYPDVVSRIFNGGHQIGSHTWSHADLATLGAEGIKSEMTQLEDVLRTMTGKAPTYMRPPYFSWTDATLSTLGELGYHVIHADIDTQDWANNTPDTISQSAQIYADGLDAGGSISLAHDVHQTTADSLVGAMISAIEARGLTAVTVGECLGDPVSNWYKD